MPRPDRRTWVPVLLAVVACLTVAVVVLVPSYRLREPDPYAYRAAAWAIEQGDLTLDDAAYVELDSTLIEAGDGWERTLVDANPTYLPAGGPGGCPQRQGSFTGVVFGEPPPIGITQWVRLDDGRCVSEKSPGYPFLVAPFDWVGLVRLAPLLFGAVGCVGLWLGARRWLGPWGGTFAVGLVLAGPGVVLMAHRAWMPTFTDALLLAGGFGFVLWAVLAVEARPGLRAAVGAAGFLLAGVATTVRLTNAVPAVVLAGWAVAVGLRRRSKAGPVMVGLWLVGAALPALALVTYDLVVFGKVWATGYEAGGGGPDWELSAVPDNLATMPARLTWAMPVWCLALLAAVVAVVLAVRRLPLVTDDVDRPASSGVGDGAVLALLALWWASVWGLYLLFGWTTEAVPPGSHPIISARFYLPAVGALALLGAWLLVRLPSWVGATAVASLLLVSLVAGVSALDGDWLFSDDLAREVVPGAPPGPGGQGSPGGPPAPAGPGRPPGAATGPGG